MSMPVRSLPVIQNWDCHGCGDCCKTYIVRVTEAERARIESQNWPSDPQMQGVELLVWDSRLNCYHLNHTAEGACVFLGPEARCRIHEKFGSAGKPMACRIYPFAFVPAGDHWRVGMRYACPSVVENKGRALPEHAKDCREYAGLLEEDAGETLQKAPLPNLQSGQTVSWSDSLLFAKAINQILTEPQTSIDFRIRKIIALSSLCRKSRFEKVTGSRLTEFLNLIIASLDDEVIGPAAEVQSPGWVGRMIFRQVIAVYVRKDNGPYSGIARQGRWTRIRAAWRFARGSGSIPRLHGLMPHKTFAEAEASAGPLSRESDQLLTRYYRVKVDSLQFFGPSNFGRYFWDGLDSLILTFPAIMWLTRVLTTPERPREAALQLALRIIDDNFGFNELLKSGRQIWATQTLTDRGELTRLVAWYGR